MNIEFRFIVFSLSVNQSMIMARDLLSSLGFDGAGVSPGCFMTGSRLGFVGEP